MGHVFILLKKMGVFRLAVFFGLVLNSQGILADEKNRESKLLPIFQVVRFPVRNFYHHASYNAIPEANFFF